MRRYKHNKGCLAGLIRMALDFDKKNKRTADLNTSFRGRYQRRYLLTKNEWYAHRKLVELAEGKNLVICPKVRLLDIIEPRSEDREYKGLLARVQSKHVDFVICNKNMQVLGVVELDDSSHDRQDRKERDQFVDGILQSVGYKVVHTRGIQVNTLDCFIEENKE